MYRDLLAVLYALVLCGCSAAILASGTDEENLIHSGTTKAELAQKLGQPLRVEPLEPRRIWDMRRGRLNLLVEPTWIRDSSGRPPQFQPPNDEVVEMAYYRYVGVLKRKHDVGEAMSLGLMTFGASEVLMTPAAISERSSGREHLLIVWFDRSGKAIAYEWGRIQPPK
jgi:hypothetical protein